MTPQRLNTQGPVFKLEIFFRKFKKMLDFGVTLSIRIVRKWHHDWKLAFKWQKKIKGSLQRFRIMTANATIKAEADMNVKRHTMLYCHKSQCPTCLLKILRFSVQTRILASTFPQTHLFEETVVINCELFSRFKSFYILTCSHFVTSQIP